MNIHSLTYENGLQALSAFMNELLAEFDSSGYGNYAQLISADKHQFHFRFGTEECIVRLSVPADEKGYCYGYTFWIAPEISRSFERSRKIDELTILFQVDGPKLFESDFASYDSKAFTRAYIDKLKKISHFIY